MLLKPRSTVHNWILYQITAIVLAHHFSIYLSSLKILLFSEESLINVINLILKL